MALSDLQALSGRAPQAIPEKPTGPSNPFGREDASKGQQAPKKSGGIFSSLMESAPVRALETVGKTIGETGVGIAKSFIKLPQTAAAFGSDLGTRAAAATMPNKSYEDLKAAQKGGAMDTATARPEWTKAHSTAEKVGETIGDVGQFFIPVGGATSAATKAGEAASGLAKAAGFGEKAISTVGKIGETGVKSILGAGEQALRTGSQEGKADAQTAIAGAIGGATPALEHVGSLADKLGNVVYSRVVPTTVKEAGKDAAKALDIGEAVSKTGISLTKNSVLTKIRDSVSSLGSQLDDAISRAVKAGKAYSIDDLVHETESALSDANLAKKMQLSPLDIADARKAVSERLAGYKELYGGKVLNEADLQSIKVGLGNGLEKVYKQALDVPLKSKALADMTFRSTLRQTIEDAVPEASPLNKKMAPLLEAEGRMLSKGSYSGYLTDVLAGGFAAGNVSDIIHDPVDYFKRFAEGVIVKRLGTSTAAKTAGGALIKAVGKIASTPQFYQSIRHLLEAHNESSDNQTSASE